MVKLKLRVCFFSILILFGLCARPLWAGQSDTCAADLVVYSFDRPMQLFALLESIDFYVTGLGEITVIYRSSDDQFSMAYEEVENCFPGVVFVKQGSNPHADFKVLTLRAAFESPHDYILFAVDDIIVKDFIDVERDVQNLELYDAYGLGDDEDYFMDNIVNPCPSGRCLCTKPV